MADGQRTTRQVVDDTRTHLSELVDAHKALARAELTDEINRQVAAVKPLVVAGVVGIYVLTFFLVTAAKGIAAAGLAEWLAWLVVSVVLLVVVLVAALVGRSRIRANKQREAAAARVRGDVQGTVQWARTRVQQQVGDQ